MRRIWCFSFCVLQVTVARPLRVNFLIAAETIPSWRRSTLNGALKIVPCAVNLKLAVIWKARAAPPPTVFSCTAVAPTALSVRCIRNVRLSGWRTPVVRMQTACIWIVGEPFLEIKPLQKYSSNGRLTFYPVSLSLSENDFALPEAHPDCPDTGAASPICPYPNGTFDSCCLNDTSVMFLTFESAVATDDSSPTAVPTPDGSDGTPREPTAAALPRLCFMTAVWVVAATAASSVMASII